jgi:excisionase family DNA binding protein
MNRTEAAEYLAIQPQTLAGWAITGKGPRMVKIGRSVRYRLEDLNEFVKSRLRGEASKRR